MSEDFFDIDFPGYAPLEVNLKNPDDFLKVRETLSRIGVASRKEKILYQSCHILHKQGRYFIVHFKELFSLDGQRWRDLEPVSRSDHPLVEQGRHGHDLGGGSWLVRRRNGPVTAVLGQ